MFIAAHGMFARMGCLVSAVPSGGLPDKHQNMPDVILASTQSLKEASLNRIRDKYWVVQIVVGVT